MPPVRKFLLIILPLMASSLIAQDRGGNGGDFLKNKFKNTGRELLAGWANHLHGDYRFDENGAWYIPVAGLLVPFDKLDLTLDDRNILIVADGKPIADRAGSHVSAKVADQADSASGVKKITLSAEKWTPFLDKKDELRELICHEMMRSIDVNDDNLQVCSHLLKMGWAPNNYQALDKHQKWVTKQRRQLNNMTPRFPEDSLNEKELETSTTDSVDERKELSINQTLVPYSMVIFGRETSDFRPFLEFSLTNFSMVFPKYVTLENQNNFSDNEFSKVKRPLFVLNYVLDQSALTAWSEFGYYHSPGGTVSLTDKRLEQVVPEKSKPCIDSQRSELLFLLNLSNEDARAVQFGKLIREADIRSYKVQINGVKSVDVEKFEKFIALENKNPRKIEHMEAIDIASMQSKLKARTMLTLSKIRMGTEEHRELTITLLNTDNNCAVLKSETLVDRLENLVNQLP